MRVVLPAPLTEGLATWRATEGTRRLVLYALLAALAYPLLQVSGTLALRLVAAACCIALAGVVLTTPRVRPFVHVLQVANVAAMLVLVSVLFVEERHSVLALGIVMLAIFGSQYAFVRRRDLACAYLVGAAFLVAYGIYRGAADPTSIAMMGMIGAAFVVAYVTGSLQIATQLTLVRESIRNEETAHLDALTGLQNRTVLYERLDGALASARRRRHDVAVLYIDLDRFKAVNDTYGHRAGDDLLVQVGCRLKAAVRTDEVAARIGGDEFVVLLPHVDKFNEPEEAAARIGRILGEPYSYEGHDLGVGASIGVARSPYDGVERERLLATADSKMYACKRGLLQEA